MTAFGNSLVSFELRLETTRQGSVVTNKETLLLNTIFCYQSLFNRHSIKMLIAAATRGRGYCNTN